MYTAISKKRACTKKAETADKVSRFQGNMAACTDIKIAYEAHKEQRRADRSAAREKKRALKSAA